MLSFFQSSYADEIVSILISQLVPYLVSLFKSKKWSDRQSMLLTVLICTLAGALSSLASHTFLLRETMTADDWMSNAIVVYTGASIAYKMYFQNTKANEQAENTNLFHPKEQP